MTKILILNPTKMTRMTNNIDLIVHGQWLGEFLTPCHMACYSYCYICEWCSEIYAKRINSNSERFMFETGICLNCVQHKPFTQCEMGYRYQDFYLVGERQIGFRSILLDKAEFIFNISLYFPQEHQDYGNAYRFTSN
jgi:hypothetical protein